MQTIHTISLPDTDLLESLSPIPDGLRAVIWDLESEPVGADLSQIDSVVLPT